MKTLQWKSGYTRNVLFDKSFQQFVYYIVGTVVHDNFISNKAHRMQVTCYVKF